MSEPVGICPVIWKPVRQSGEAIICQVNTEGRLVKNGNLCWTQSFAAEASTSVLVAASFYSTFQTRRADTTFASHEIRGRF